MNQERSKKLLIVSGSVLVIAILGWSVFALNQAKNQTPVTSDVASNTQETPDPADRVAPTPSERVTITATQDGFEPSELTVKRGTIIAIKNESGVRVQFSSDNHPTHRKNSEMNLKILAPGESDSYTAETAGEWGFHDHINDQWTGKITVKE